MITPSPGSFRVVLAASGVRRIENWPIDVLEGWCVKDGGMGAGPEGSGSWGGIGRELDPERRLLSSEERAPEPLLLLGGSESDCDCR